MKNEKVVDKSPLILVLAEFRFSPIKKISSLIEDIQDGVRKKLPLYQEIKGTEVQVNNHKVNSVEKTAWVFQSSCAKNAMIINDEKMAFLTSNYSEFSNFKDFCKECLSIVKKIADPSLIERIGLRYSNTFTDKNLDLIDSLQDTMTEFNNIGKKERVIKESLIRTDTGVMNIRSMYLNSNVLLWPDINFVPVDIDDNDSQSQRFLLDIDHYWLRAGVEEFSVDFILTKLEDLHTKSKESFCEIVRSEKDSI